MFTLILYILFKLKVICCQKVVYIGDLHTVVNLLISLLFISMHIPRMWSVQKVLELSFYNFFGHA
jgi:hypothetical protein